MKHAFRCKNCGFLHTSDEAGEADHPHSCRVCGKGVTHSAVHHEIDQLISKGDVNGMQNLANRVKNREIDLNDQTKTIYPDNWEILADCKPERLAELGLKSEHVEKHVPKDGPKGRVPRNIRVFTEDGAGITKQNLSEVSK